MFSIVTVSGVSFELSNGREILSQLNFSLDRRITALVGPNGVGKTTLAKLLYGDLEPTSGSIRRNAPIHFFQQRSDPNEIRVADFLGDSYCRNALSTNLLADIELSRLCTELSGGQWMRVRLAAMVDDSFLILDEPTNDLDREGRSAVLEFLRNRKSGALIISHDRELLSVCNEILELSNQGLAKFGGGWGDYLKHKELECENLERSLELAKTDREKAATERQEKLSRQAKRNRRGSEAAAKGGLPKILLGRRKRIAQTTSGKITKLTSEKADQAVRKIHASLRELKIEPVMYASLMGEKIPSQKLIAEASEFNVRFEDWIYTADLNFCWRGNVRLALKGANGSGKSTLLRAILGSNFDTRGELRRGTLRTLYVDQSCASLEEELSVFENVLNTSSFSESEIRNELSKFLFTQDSVFQKVKDLSGGERLRAVLAVGFLTQEKPELLVLDEPTNNLDLMNIEFLENLVREFQGALLVISHDEVFLKNCGIQEELLI